MYIYLLSLFYDKVVIFLKRKIFINSDQCPAKKPNERWSTFDAFDALDASIHSASAETKKPCVLASVRGGQKVDKGPANPIIVKQLDSL
jgi:hypothetical protein